MNIKDQLAIQAMYSGGGPVVAAVTRDDVGKMKRPELVEHLEAHGANTDGKIGDLRNRLIATLFVEM